MEQQNQRAMLIEWWTAEGTIPSSDYRSAFALSDFLRLFLNCEAWSLVRTTEVTSFFTGFLLKVTQGAKIQNGYLLSCPGIF